MLLAAVANGSSKPSSPPSTSVLQCDMVGERGRWAFAHTCFRGSTPRGKRSKPWPCHAVGKKLVGATAHMKASQNKAVRIGAELVALERLYGQQTAVVSVALAAPASSTAAPNAHGGATHQSEASGLLGLMCTCAGAGGGAGRSGCVVPGITWIPP
ncbi:hypothetical protein HaLaN_31866 [Haematococcus lacustris]|uniref:Uncharacterized protein n=1 Tax=Haematococcus lacustris TaxID=44745 RepID=A0A6A0AI81_HAELA|nr:hypothetical protein HaLaN_31866 [Haematococcus lacustris]